MSTLADLTSGTFDAAIWRCCRDRVRWFDYRRNLLLLSRDRQGAFFVVTEPRPSGSVFRGQSATRRTGGGMERMEAIKHIARQRGMSKREVYQAVTGS